MQSILVPCDHAGYDLHEICTTYIDCQQYQAPTEATPDACIHLGETLSDSRTDLNNMVVSRHAIPLST